MKKFLLTILVLASVVSWRTVDASFLGIKKSTETIQFPVLPPLDSAGIPGTPDSIQVITRLDGATTASYKATGAGYTCAGVDTGAEYGGVQIWFTDAIEDIDGAGGNAELAIDVITWYKKLPTHTFATVQVIGDSLGTRLRSAVDSSAAAAVRTKNLLDSVQAQDGWIAKEASVQIVRDTQNLHSPRIDSLLASAGHTAKVGTDQIWQLRGLHVRGTTTGDTAIIADANNGNSSRGFFIRGGNAAFECKATGTILGVGILARGSDKSVGVGMQLEPGGTLGDGLLANGYGATHAGIRCASIPGSGNSFMADDGFWANGATITGNIIGRVDSIGAGGVNAFWNKPYNTSFVAGSMGDSLNNNQFATLAASIMGVPLGVWNVKFDSSGIAAGSMGDSLTNGSYVQGAASGLDSATVEGAAKAALQAGIDVNFGKIHATNLIVIDAADDDTGGVYIHSSLDDGVHIWSDSMRAIRADAYGSRPTIAVYAHNNGDGIRSEILAGATGSGSALALINSGGGTTTGRGLRIQSSAAFNTVDIGNTSNALLGRAWYTYTTGDSASTFVMSNGSNDLNINTHTIDVEGSSAFYSRYDRNEPAFLIHQFRAGSYPALYIYSDSSAAIRASTANPTYYDTAVTIGGHVTLSGNKFVGNIIGNITGNLAGHVDTVNYTIDGNITATLSGTGAYTYSLLLLDTTASPDAPINGAEVTIRNLAQTNYIAWAHTNVNGMAYFNLDTGQYAVLAKRAGYYFKTPDTVHLVGVMSDTTEAYVLDIGKVTVSGRIYGMSRDSLRDAKITFSMPYGRVWADVDSAIYYPTDVSAYTDSTGYFSLGVLASTKMFVQTPADTLKYNVSIDYQGKQIQSFKSVVVPDVTSVTFNPTITRR